MPKGLTHDPQLNNTTLFKNLMINPMMKTLTVFSLITCIVLAPVLYAEADRDSHDDHPTLIVSEVPT